MEIHHTLTLPNGLKIIHEPSLTEVVYCGFIINAGTRDEEAADSGMAHFCEHLTFKGTARRKACHIRNGLERVGGDLNAYTNKEETVFYASVLREDFSRAVDLLSDIVFHSVYPQQEINKEVEVIADEIDSYKDSPDELIFDEFEEMLFRGHALGRNILGEPKRLHEYQTEDACRFTHRYYCPSNTTFFVFGQVDFKRVVRELEKATAGLVAGDAQKVIAPLPVYVPEERVVERGTHQAHVLIGTRAYDAQDERRMGLFLLSNMLGGPGMNARLNVSLRERHGLVYTVETIYSHYSDAGFWSTYFGCDAHDIAHCRRLVIQELQRLCAQPLSATQLAAAKKQLKGQIGISCDNFENYALAMGKVYAHYGYHRDIKRIFSQIEALTSEGLQEIACDIFKEDRLTTLIYR